MDLLKTIIAVMLVMAVIKLCSKEGLCFKVNDKQTCVGMNLDK